MTRTLYWLKQRDLSEIRAQVDESKLVFKFLLRNFDKFDPNETSPATKLNKRSGNELFVCIKYGSQRPLLATTVLKLYYNIKFC